MDGWTVDRAVRRNVQECRSEGNIMIEQGFISGRAVTVPRYTTSKITVLRKSNAASKIQRVQK